MKSFRNYKSLPGSRYKVAKNVRYRYGAKMQRNGYVYQLAGGVFVSVMVGWSALSFAVKGHTPPRVLTWPSRLFTSLDVKLTSAEPLPMLDSDGKPIKDTGNGTGGHSSGSAPSVSSLPGATMSHKNIITTIFWAGEGATSENGFISNTASAWDDNWKQHYGGIDSPTNRNGYLPAGFTPKENPFYVALPYNDMTVSGHRKASAAACLNSGIAALAKYSWCKNVWVAVKHGNKIAYAQWEDVGPYEEDDTAYVFGTAAPKNKQDSRAGLDVSPAMATYLGLDDVSHADWAFISAADVPDGPWKKVVTTSLGYSVSP